MQNLFVVFLLAVLVSFVGAGPASATDGTAPPEAWRVRCSAEEGTPGRECEIFQLLVMKETGLRVAEFAVGFPPEQKKAGGARGVVVLPLGILLDKPMIMQVDQNKAFQFKPRYCTQQGCYSFLDLNAGIISLLKAGKEITLKATAFTGKELAIKMTLDGFSAALAELPAP